MKKTEQFINKNKKIMKIIETYLYRFANAADYTYGTLYKNKLNPKYPDAFTIEDEKRIEKVSGETRIPAGRYEIKFREIESGLTLKYRNLFPGWFTYHLELQNVPNFNYVYIHVGSTDEHTDACICIADVCDLSPPTQDGLIYESATCYEKFYKDISAEFNKGNRVFITIYDNFKGV